MGNEKSGTPSRGYRGGTGGYLEIWRGYREWCLGVYSVNSHQDKRKDAPALRMTEAPVVREGTSPAIAPMKNVTTLIRNGGTELVIVGQVTHPEVVEDLLGRPLQPGEAVVTVDPTSFGAAILEHEDVIREHLAKRSPRWVLAHDLTEEEEERLADWAVRVTVSRRPRLLENEAPEN